MDAQISRTDATTRSSGPQWLTYVELGERLGITPDAARQKAIRGRWRKQKGNDGKARVLVEPEVLQRPVQTPSTPDHTDDQVVIQSDVIEAVQAPSTPPSTVTEAALVAVLEDQLGFLKGLVESERARADRLQEELLALAKTHMATLEELAVREVPKRRSWWRRLVG